MLKPPGPLPLILTVPAVLSNAKELSPPLTVKGEPTTALPFTVTVYVPGERPENKYCAVPLCVLVNPAMVEWVVPPRAYSATLASTGPTTCTPVQFESGDKS